MSIFSLLLALLALVPATVDDDLVAEFNVYFGDKDRSPTQRREAVLTLAESDSASAVRALLQALEDDEFTVRRAAIDIMGSFTTENGARWLVESVLEDRKASKNELLVAGVAEVLGGMGYEPAFEHLLELLEHRELGVRLGAIAGLGRMGRADAVPPLHALMQDRESSIVISVLDAMVAIGGEAVEPTILEGLTHADKSVRLKAIEASEALRLKAAVRPLIMMLDNDPDGRVQEDAFEVLTTLTLRNFRDNTPEWLSWWDRAEGSFELPDPEKIAAARKRIAESGGRYNVGKKSFQDIETKSDNIVFVIDVSQSMSEPFGDIERLKRSGREYDSLQRLAIVKQELIDTIGSLPDSTVFNILSFASDVDPWKKKATKANVLNKNNAQSWVADLEPKGGTSGAFRARMGLNAPMANDGMTNTHKALMAAFGEDVDDKKKRGRATSFVTSPDDPIDTIFFLTDGEPTVGKTVDMAEIIEEVRRVNAFRGVQLHVIYVGAFGGKDFKQLAEENDGVFVNIGG